ncbi:MAG: hypothetical protein RJA99_4994 [Pseudomonadota bacterium]
MNNRFLVASAVAFGLLASPMAFAQPKGTSPEPQPPAGDKSSLRTRAEVKAECDAARKAGTIPQGECVNPADMNTKSTKTRAQVQAECDAARKAGTMPKAECSN